MINMGEFGEKMESKDIIKIMRFLYIAFLVLWQS